MDSKGRQLPKNAPTPATTAISSEFDEELRRRCMEAVERMARWLDEMESERARQPRSPLRRSSVAHDPFYWG